jgi:predicted NBD/HSP70 family sugar kinase
MFGSIPVKALDERDGRLLVAPNLGWSDVPIVDELAARLGSSALGIHADNEANLAGLAELWLGDGARDGDYVDVSGEIGIGAGIVVDGRLFRGSRGFAGEIGHIVVDPGGPPCACGGRGCLERVAGRERSSPPPVSPPPRPPASDTARARFSSFSACSTMGIPPRRAALGDAGAALGIALADVINLIDVDTIVLGGIHAQFTPWLVGPLSRELEGQVIAASERAVTIRPSALGPDAAVRGAATCVAQQILPAPAAQ